MSTPAILLEANGLTKVFPVHRNFRQVGAVHALSGVSFQLGAQETLAIVGESGCGKSTLAKLLMQIEKPTAGSIKILGQSPEQMAPLELRQSLQMIFQDPYSSINPRKRAWEIIAEPLAVNTKLSRSEQRARAEQMMAKVGLRPELAKRYPHMFSGGQRQRIGTARALMLEPKVLICDEPVSALDLSIQAQILNLLLDLQQEMRLAYIFISHDLGVVEHIADRVLVIYLGRVVEYGSREQIFNAPQHPYTQALIACAPRVGRSPGSAVSLRGEIPSRLEQASGCVFHQRCPYAQIRCQTEEPKLKMVAGRETACHYAENLKVR